MWRRRRGRHVKGKHHQPFISEQACPAQVSEDDYGIVVRWAVTRPAEQVTVAEIRDRLGHIGGFLPDGSWTENIPTDNPQFSDTAHLAVQ